MLQRLPRMQDILPVYAVIATIIFSWSILAFVWKLPSWILFLHIGEILSILAYTLAVDLFESLIWLALFLVICLLLPGRFLRDKFTERGTILSLLILGSLAVYINQYAALGQELLDHLWLWTVVTLTLSIVLAAVSTRLRFLESGALWIADHLTIFLFLYIPLAVFSVLVVLLRNIF